MKTIKKWILLFCFFLAAIISKAQVPDLECIPNTFFGAVGNTAHRLQWNGTTVQDLGVIAGSSYSSILSMAYGNDILNNSTNRTLYSSVQVFQTPCAVIRFNGSGWDTVATDSLIFHNAGGYGRFLYFQHGGGSDDECIKRLNPNGTLTEIFNDSSQFVFTVADIVVDSAGNIYCFRGSAVGSTSEITKIDSSGNILNSYSTNLNNFTGLYGAMFFNGTLYLGQTTHQLFPVIFSGTTASLGTPVNTPSSFTIKDLAECHDIISGIQDAASPLFQVYYNNMDNSLEIFNPYASRETVRIFSADGRLLKTDFCVTGNNSYNLLGYSSGIFIVVIENKERTFVKKFGVFRQ